MGAGLQHVAYLEATCVRWIHPRPCGRAGQRGRYKLHPCMCLSYATRQRIPAFVWCRARRLRLILAALRMCRRRAAPAGCCCWTTSGRTTGGIGLPACPWGRTTSSSTTIRSSSGRASSRRPPWRCRYTRCMQVRGPACRLQGLGGIQCAWPHGMDTAQGAAHRPRPYQPPACWYRSRRAVHS